jgi:hypothetical protein
MSFDRFTTIFMSCIRNDYMYVKHLRHVAGAYTNDVSSFVMTLIHMD